MKFKTIFLAFILIALAFSMKGQTVSSTSTDTIKVDEATQKHSPKKATIMSLVLPGLGQAYNKKYWKIPIVYAIIATPLYFALDQQKQFNEYKEAYVKRVDDDPNTIDLKYKNVYSNDNLINLVDFHRKNRDLFFVLTGVAYILNVVDAAVDAHLYYFDVSDDISGVVKPNFQYNQYDRTIAPSFTLNLTFGKQTPNLIRKF